MNWASLAKFLNYVNWAIDVLVLASAIYIFYSILHKMKKNMNAGEFLEVEEMKSAGVPYRNQVMLGLFAIIAKPEWEKPFHRSLFLSWIGNIIHTIGLFSPKEKTHILPEIPLDVAEAYFLAKGFSLTDWNEFKSQVKNQHEDILVDWKGAEGKFPMYKFDNKDNPTKLQLYYPASIQYSTASEVARDFASGDTPQSDEADLGFHYVISKLLKYKGASLMSIQKKQDDENRQRQEKIK